jgi:lipoate-protein ligase A
VWLTLTLLAIVLSLLFRLGSQEDLAARGALMLWTNSPSVVIGRNQNAWNECNLNELARRGVQLARRASGGGAVFHDLGNLNLTFFSTREAFSKEANSAILAAALNGRRIGGGGGGGGGGDSGGGGGGGGSGGGGGGGGGGDTPMVEVNDRSDLVVGGRKVSGSAYRLNRTTAYHHCTLLVNTDLTALKGALRPTLPRIVTKGIASVRYACAPIIAMPLPFPR